MGAGGRAEQVAKQCIIGANFYLFKCFILEGRGESREMDRKLFIVVIIS